MPPGDPFMSTRKESRLAAPARTSRRPAKARGLQALLFMATAVDFARGALPPGLHIDDSTVADLLAGKASV